MATVINRRIRPTFLSLRPVGGYDVAIRAPACRKPQARFGQMLLRTVYLSIESCGGGGYYGYGRWGAGGGAGTGLGTVLVVLLVVYLMGGLRY